MLAPAKINLMLHVTGKRPDGYHLLQSLIMFADIGDEVVLHAASEFNFHINGEYAKYLTNDKEHNLVYKAATAFAQATQKPLHIDIELIKHLPIGAGLGGGSSDAARTLKTLSGLWECPIPDTLPLHLGSDVPACIYARPTWMEGIGEQLTPIKIPFSIHCLLASPRIDVSSREIYQQLTPPYDDIIDLPESFADYDALLTFLTRSKNRLETPAIQVEPHIENVLAALRLLPGCDLARMSGSGSTCIGLFPTENACNDAKNMLQTTYPHWWINTTTLQGTYGQT